MATVNLGRSISTAVARSSAHGPSATAGGHGGKYVLLKEFIDIF